VTDAFVELTSPERLAGARTWLTLPALGVAFSGLNDDVYTTRVVQDRPTIVREAGSVVSPEASMAAVISRRNSRYGFIFGFGIARDGAGRIHGGYGLKLGDAAMFSVGVAVGSVQRLSASVDRFRPDVSLVELPYVNVMRVAPFVAISYTINGSN